MECGPSATTDGLPKISEEERKETEKFLADSWYNLLHMFDDENSSETGNFGQYPADIYTSSNSNAAKSPKESRA
ncbi:phosphoribosyl transferase [Corchorus olitorius]|uniref:Phosphoribosyl transferase n=1 Tax=Corchorus olitorius TaxID=93759 RepID=A0A1R3KGG1_9ROSI|nr:phosphoribosyl transferase [Corchorus olitorius]